VYIALTQPLREGGMGLLRWGFGMRHFVLCAIAIALLHNPCFAASSGFMYSGGTTTIINVPGATETEAFGINNAGQIVGDYSNDGGATRRGFLLSGATYSTFAAPGATTTIPLGINNSGQIVGYAIGPALTTSGFVYSNGAFTSINIIAPPALTWAYAINDQSQIAGVYASTPFPTHGFLLSGGNLTDIDVPGSLSTAPTGLNNSSTVVGIFGNGNSGPQSFLYDGNAFQTLSIPGANFTYATDINNSGDVLFQSNLGNYVLSNGTYSPLLPYSYEAFGFNDLGQVVGRVSGVPGPAVGAGLPGLLMAIAGFIGWRRSRRGHLRSAGCPI
jgi:probable HAF family extracellular repeat protein